VSGKGSSVEAYASSIPVTYKTRPILLTAKHVLDRLNGRRLYLETPDHFRLLALNPAFIAEDPQADAAAILLPEAAFQWNIDFLQLDIQFEPAVSEGEVGVFLAMGFPWKETTIDFKAGTLALKMVNYWSFENAEGYRLLRLSPQMFLTTGFDTKNAVQDGMTKQMKLPEGMSGGAVWRFWGSDTQYPSLERAALAGMITEYHKTPVKCLVSARIGVLQALAADLVSRAGTL
jgi:hypothetical protein